MEKKKIVLYVLHGAWDTAYTDGTGVIGISENIEELHNKLQQIEETKAKEYLENPYGDIEEDTGIRHYEIRDAAGGYAKFYITEHYVELSDELILALYKRVSEQRTEESDTAYTYRGMKKLTWRDIVELHHRGELAGCYLLYSDNTESQIEEDYKWTDIVEHFEKGGEFVYEL